MRKSLLLTMALVVTLAMTAVGGALASDAMLKPFTQDELDTSWEADRQFPTGGVSSVTDFGRDNVAHLGIDSAQTDSNTFRRTEGIKTVTEVQDDFGQAVQVDLYLDPDWAEKAVRAGLWVVGDDGSGERDNWFGIIEFVNLEPSTSGDSAEGDHTGWRVWSSTEGWTNLNTEFAYDEWVTLLITLEDGSYRYDINGETVGSAPAGDHFIREVFLNSYNYGLDEFPNLSNDDYAAHWHAGLREIAKDECQDGSWEAAGFRNQGQCIRFVNTGQDSR